MQPPHTSFVWRSECQKSAASAVDPSSTHGRKFQTKRIAQNLHANLSAESAGVSEKCKATAITGTTRGAYSARGMTEIQTTGANTGTNPPCRRRLNIDPPGVRRKSWTGLCRKSEALSVFEWTE